MKRPLQGIGLARFKYLNGFLFIALGLMILFQFVHGVGLRLEAIGGWVLAAAMIGLGVYRLRLGWPRP